MGPEDRAHKGIFLSFQYPVEIPGVTVTNFIKTAINETRKASGLEELPAKDMLKLKLAILDETDSGLDIDALKIVANGVNKLKSKDSAVIVITHYQRLLDYIVPDYVHVLYNGRIVKSGTKELALELEEKGYDWLKEDAVV